MHRHHHEMGDASATRNNLCTGKGRLHESNHLDSVGRGRGGNDQNGEQNVLEIHVNRGSRNNEMNQQNDDLESR